MPDSARRRRASRRRARPADRGQRRQLCRTGPDVERIVVQGGRATGCRTTGGEIVGARPRSRLQRHADAALRTSARASDVPADVAAGRQALPFRPLGDADPLRAVGAAALGRATSGSHERRSSTSRRASTASRAPSTRPSAACCPAEATVVVGQPLDDGRVARAGRQRFAVDPAAGAAVAREGRRRRRARRRRRHLDRVAARALRRPDPGADRRARPQPRVVDPQARRALAGRPPGGEHQPRAGRSVLRLARARPELPLAAVRAAARAPHARRPPLPHRREHVARARVSAAGSGTLVAQELLRPPAAEALARTVGVFRRSGQA